MTAELIKIRILEKLTFWDNTLNFTVYIIRTK